LHGKGALAMKKNNKKILRIIQEMLNRRIKSGRVSGSEFKPYIEYHYRKILVKKYFFC
jgi:hypothetical protein